MHTKIALSLLLILFIGPNKQINSCKYYVFLHKNTFTHVEKNALCSNYIYGKYHIKKNRITFKCDSIFHLSYKCSATSSADSFIVIINSSDPCFPICPDIDFYHDNDSIDNFSFLKPFNTLPKFAKKNINTICVKEFLSFKGYSFKLEKIPDTLFINAEHLSFNQFHNKTYIIKNKRKQKYIEIDTNKVYIENREPKFKRGHIIFD